MSFLKVLPLVALAVLIAPGADAQNSGEAAKPAAGDRVHADVPEGGVPRYIRPETPEQRRERLATDADPGLDPDPKKVWNRYGRKFTIHKVEKRWSKYFPDRPGIIRPMMNMNIEAEIYQENDKYVWFWIEEFDVEEVREERAAEARAAIPQELIDYAKFIRPEFTPLDPPKSDVIVKFEEASNGLPTDGTWRNSLAVADMNGDGHMDIVLPPQRGTGNPDAYIYLGDGKGNWRQWDVKWPAPLNYGSVVAADFNKDKKMDLAFGVHLSGVAIFLGDGKGGFRQVERVSNYPTRRIRVADVDADGWLDVVAISEGPFGRGGVPRGEATGNLRAHLNRAKGEKWEAMNIAEPKQPISGDWLAAGNFNGDKYPDFVGSNVYFGATQTIYLSKGKKEYAAIDDLPGAIVPYRSYYHAVTAGPFSSKKRDDAVVAYFRFWPTDVPADVVSRPPLERVVGLDRISFTGGKPTRSPIVRWKPGRDVQGLANGDFDGDGHLDIVFTRDDPRELVLLVGDGQGNFRRAEIEGLELSDLPNYDLTAADVNGDGRPDIVVMYAAETGGTALSPDEAGVYVFFNRGVAE